MLINCYDEVKKIFFVLLLVNIVVAYSFYTAADNRLSDPDPVSQLHPEKIKLLSHRVTCLEWSGLIDPIVQQVRADLSAPEWKHIRWKEVADGKISVHAIYIPPFRTVWRNERLIERLEKLQIPYLHLQESTAEPWHNSILLGVTPEIEAAQALLDELNSHGMTRVVHDEQQLEQFFFLIFEPTAQITEKIKALTDQFFGSRLEITECDRDSAARI